MPFSCSICGEESTRICARCTKDACDNHLCEKCRHCSDCCECEVALDEPIREPMRPAPAHVAEPVIAVETESVAEFTTGQDFGIEVEAAVEAVEVAADVGVPTEIAAEESAGDAAGEPEPEPEPAAEPVAGPVAPEEEPVASGEAAVSDEPAPAR